MKKNNIEFFVFLLSLFLIKIPSFYISPLFSKLTSSHTVSKVIIICLFLFSIKNKRQQIYNLIRKNFFILITGLFFLIAISFSILKSIDVFLFIKIYHNYLINYAILILTILFLKKKANFSIVKNYVFIVGFILIVIEVLYFIFPNQASFIVKTIVQQEFADGFLTYAERDRYSLQLNLELFLPFFLIGFFINKDRKITHLVAIFFICFLSFFTNTRTRVVIFLFSSLMFLLFYFRFYKKNNLKMVFFSIFTILVPIIIALIASNSFFSFNVIDRLRAKNLADLGSINFRLFSIKQSFNVFLSNPVLGVGLGNFIFYNKIPKGDIVYGSYKRFSDNVYYYPHNEFFQILSEAGIAGFTFFVLIILLFIKDDYIFLKNPRSYFKVASIISFWSLFVYIMLNPGYSVFVSGWLWFMRGLIISA